jgi:hypothetical protein
MLFNSATCIKAYGTYSSGTKYKVKYSSNPSVFVKTNLSVNTTPISNNIYVLKYDINSNEICVLSKAIELGLSEEDYNFTMSILGAIFGLSVFTLIMKAL